MHTCLWLDLACLIFRALYFALISFGILNVELIKNAVIMRLLYGVHLGELGFRFYDVIVVLHYVCIQKFLVKRCGCYGGFIESFSFADYCVFSTPLPDTNSQAKRKEEKSLGFLFEYAPCPLSKVLGAEAAMGKVLQFVDLSVFVGMFHFTSDGEPIIFDGQKMTWLWRWAGGLQENPCSNANTCALGE